MPHITSPDGTVIAYDERGSGPPVLLVNGAMAYREHHSDRPLAEELSGAFTVICYDRRGRGESTDASPYDVAREIEDIHALIEAAGGRAHLYGFSSGAALALRAAAALQGRVTRLALCDAPFSPATDEERTQFAEYRRDIDELLRTGRPGDAAARFLADMLDPEVLESLRRSADWQSVERVAPTLAYDNAVLGDGTLPVATAEEVVAPTLVIGAEIMPFTVEAAESLAQHIPGARLQIVGQPSPEVLAPLLIDFFSAMTTKA